MKNNKFRHKIKFVLPLILAVGFLSGCNSKENENFTVVFNGNGGKLVSGEETQVVDSGWHIDAPTYEKVGYTFAGWDIDITTLEDDANVHALWDERVFTISYSLNGGENDPRNPEEFTYLRNTFKLYPATKKGYTFKGWYDINSNTYINNIDPKNLKDYTLVAKYDTDNFNINYKLNGGEHVDEYYQKFTYDINGGQKIQNASKKGSTFLGWKILEYSDEIYKDLVLPSGLTGDITLEAIFEKNQYKISFDLNGSEEIINDVIIFYGDNYNLPTPQPREGYTFKGWYDEKLSTYVDNNDVFKYTNDCTLKAMWQGNTYIIEYYYILGDTIQRDNVYSSYQPDVGRTITSYKTFAGYEFFGFQYDPNSNEVFDSYEIKPGTLGDIKVYYKYIPKQYTVSYYYNDICVCESDTFTFGQPYVLKNYEEEDFTLTNWVNTNDSTTIPKSGIWNYYTDLQLEAVGTYKKYNISYDLDGGINNPENPNSYTIKTEDIEIKKPSKEGWVFLYWTLDDKIVTTISPSLKKDITLVAHWEAIENTITLDFDSEKGFASLSTYQPTYGESITITSTPNTGYIIKGIYINNSFVSNKESFTFIMPLHDVVIFVSFEIEDSSGFGIEPYFNGNTLVYGLYPSDELTNSGIIKYLNSDNISSLSNGYKKYRGQYYYKEKDKWFVCKPIEWIKEGSYYISKNVLDCQAFDINDEIPAHDYPNSSIRKWLNNEFFNLAFSLDSSHLLDRSFVINEEEITDKIFLPDKTASIFKTDSAMITDYSEYCGAYNDWYYDSCLTLSPDDNDYYSEHYIWVNSDYSVYRTYKYAVRPMINFQM